MRNKRNRNRGISVGSVMLLFLLLLVVAVFAFHPGSNGTDGPVDIEPTAGSEGQMDFLAGTAWVADEDYSYLVFGSMGEKDGFSWYERVDGDLRISGSYEAFINDDALQAVRGSMKAEEAPSKEIRSVLDVLKAVFKELDSDEYIIAIDADCEGKHRLYYGCYSEEQLLLIDADSSERFSFYKLVPIALDDDSSE